MILADAELKWHDNKLFRLFHVSGEAATKRAAKRVLRDAKANLAGQVTQRTGDLMDSLHVFKSKNDELSYLVGVFVPDEWSGDYQQWMHTTGARAVFIEYGHALPYQGRGYVRKRENIEKGVEDRPFLRPALDNNGGYIKSSYHNIL